MSPPQATNVAERADDEVKKIYDVAWNIEIYFPAQARHGKKADLVFYL